MIALDTNLLVYAHRARAPEHARARRAMERAAADGRGWGMASAALSEFWAVVTHPAAPGRASTPGEAAAFIEALQDAGAELWLPGPGFGTRLLQVAVDRQVTGPRISISRLPWRRSKAVRRNSGRTTPVSRPSPACGCTTPWRADSARSSEQPSVQVLPERSRGLIVPVASIYILYIYMDARLDRELKRGSAALLILALVEDRPRHGYEIGQIIRERSGGAIAFNVASLYPTLYRLEAEGLIEGRWVEKAGQRRRRYYRLTPQGRKALASHRRSWDAFFVALDRVAGIRHA